MQTNPLARMTAAPDLDTSLLAERARDVLKRCQARGADAVEIGVSEEYGLNVGVRLGDVETLEHSSDRGLSITVYFGLRKGSASTADFDPSSIEASIEQACAIARYTEEDPFAGLADPQRMATEFPDLDLWHPQPLDVDHAIASALACEAAGREDKRITNVDGTNWSSGGSAFAYANSHGFVGVERGTSHTISCSLIAGKGDAMQRDYWYDNARNAGDLSSPEAVDDVIVDHPRRLHVRIDDGGADELEAALLEVLGDRLREFGLGGNLPKRRPSILDRLATG